jgi:hypothetical protein
METNVDMICWQLSSPDDVAQLLNPHLWAYADGEGATRVAASIVHFCPIFTVFVLSASQQHIDCITTSAHCTPPDQLASKRKELDTVTDS